MNMVFKLIILQSQCFKTSVKTFSIIIIISLFKTTWLFYNYAINNVFPYQIPVIANCCQ